MNSMGNSPEEICQLLENCSAVVQRSANDEERNEVTKVLVQFRCSVSPYHTCMMLLKRAKNVYAQHFAITTIKEAALREWGKELSPQEGIQIADSLLNFIYEQKSSGNPPIASFVATQLMHVVALLHKRNWPVGPLRNAPGVFVNGQDLPAPLSKSTYGTWDWDYQPLSESTSPAELAVITELGNRAKSSSSFLLDRVRSFLSLPDIESQEHGAMLAHAIITEFSAPHSGSLGSDIPWDFHALVHTSFETHGLRDLYVALASSLSSFSPYLSSSSLAQADASKLSHALLRNLSSLRAILSFDFDERNSLPVTTREVLSNAASKENSVRSLVLGAFHTPSLIAREQSIDEDMMREEIRPGSLWSDVLLSSQLIPTLLNLYQAIVHHIPYSTAGCRVSSSLTRVAEVVLSLLVQLSSLAGSIFAGEKAVTDILLPSIARLGISNEREKLIVCATAMQSLRDASEGFPFMSFQLPVGHNPSAYNETLASQYVLVPNEPIRLFQDYFSQVSQVLAYFANRAESYPFDVRSTNGLFSIEIRGVSQLLLRASQRFSLSFLLNGRDQSVLGIMLRYIRIVLTPEIIARHGETSLDTWASEAWENLLEACTTFASKRSSASTSSASSPQNSSAPLSPQSPNSSFLNPDHLRLGRSYSHSQASRAVDSDLIAYLELSLSQVLGYYVDLRLNMCHSEANTAESDFQYDDEDAGDAGNEQFVNNSNTEQVLICLATIARLSLDQSIPLLSSRIQNCLSKLRMVASDPSSSHLSVTGDQECLWFLFQLLLHVLCTFDESGETPSIPTALISYSNAYHQANPANAGTDPLLEAMNGVFDYISFENDLLMQSFQSGSDLQELGMLSSTKSDILSPYVSQSVLRLLKIWLACYIHPSEAAYTEVSNGLWKLVGYGGSFVSSAIGHLLKKCVSNLLLWGEEGEVARSTCSLLYAITSNRGLLPTIMHHQTQVRELVLIFKIACFQDNLDLALKVPAILHHTCLDPSQTNPSTQSISIPEFLRLIIEQKMGHILQTQQSVNPHTVITPEMIQTHQLQLLSTCLRLPLSTVVTLESSLFQMISPNQATGLSFGEANDAVMPISPLNLFCELIRPIHARIITLMQSPLAQYLESSRSQLGPGIMEHPATLVKEVLKKFSSQQLSEFYSHLENTLVLLSAAIPSSATPNSPVLGSFLSQWFPALLTLWQNLRLITSLADQSFLRLFKKVLESELLTNLSSPHIVEFLAYTYAQIISIFTTSHHDLVHLFSIPLHLDVQGSENSSILSGTPLGAWQWAKLHYGHSTPTAIDVFTRTFSELSIWNPDTSSMDAQNSSQNGTEDSSFVLSPAAASAQGIDDEASSNSVPTFVNSLYNSESTFNMDVAKRNLSLLSPKQGFQLFLNHCQRLSNDVCMFLYISELISKLRSFRIYEEDDVEQFDMFLKANEMLTSRGLNVARSHISPAFRQIEFPQALYDLLAGRGVNPALIQSPERNNLFHVMTLDFHQQPTTGQKYIECLFFHLSLETLRFTLEFVIPPSTIACQSTMQSLTSKNLLHIAETSSYQSGKELITHIANAVVNISFDLISTDMPLFSNTPGVNHGRQQRTMTVYPFSTGRTTAGGVFHQPSDLENTTQVTRLSGDSLLSQVMLLTSEILFPSLTSVMIPDPLALQHFHNTTSLPTSFVLSRVDCRVLSAQAVTSSFSSTCGMFLSRVVDLYSSLAMETILMLRTAKESLNPQSSGSVVDTNASLKPRASDVAKLKNYISIGKSSPQALQALGPNWPSAMTSLLPYSQRVLHASSSPMFVSSSSEIRSNGTMSLAFNSFLLGFSQLMTTCLFTKIQSGAVNSSGKDISAVTAMTTVASPQATAILSLVNNGCPLQKYKAYVSSLSSLILFPLWKHYYEATATVTAQPTLTGASLVDAIFQEMYSLYVNDLKQAIEIWVSTEPLFFSTGLDTVKLNEMKTFIFQSWTGFFEKLFQPQPSNQNHSNPSSFTSQLTSFFGKSITKMKAHFQQDLIDHIQTLQAVLKR